MRESLIGLLPVAVPALGAVLYAGFGWRRSTAWIGPVCALGLLASGVALAVTTSDGVAGTVTAVAGLVRVDALSAFMLVVVGVVATVATAATPAYLRAEISAGHASARTAHRHCALVQAFLAAMAAAIVAANLGVLWVAIEATTIATAFLVGQRRTRPAVEAAWKYVVICSVGVAIALLGTILLNYASGHGLAQSTLDLATLTYGAGQLDPGVTRIAVALLLLGFGTKAGLAPLHAWLPDAHSQAPAPVSALMSGVLLSVAFYAILRVKAIADGALGPAFTRTILVAMALISLAVAASLILGQRDYKRMLAYSSVEHSGLLAFGAAVGGRLALAAVLLHMLGHGLVKAVLFLGAGRVTQTVGSSAIAGVRGLAVRQPLLAGGIGFGVLALIGLPPFSLFASELGIARAGFAANLGWATALALLLMLVIAAGMLTHTARMMLGAAGPVGTVPPVVRLPRSTGSTLVGGLVVAAALGVTAGPLAALLTAAAAAGAS